MPLSLESLAARCEVYGLLTRAYYGPADGFLPDGFAARLAAALTALGLPPAPEDLTALEAAAGTADPLELAVEYTRLFRGPVKAQAYPYESMYTDGEVLGRSALDVMREYEQAGVGVSAEFKDLPDHIAAELEFMHYLCAREFEAGQAQDWEEAARFHRIGRSFVKDHLARWVPAFADCISQHATSHFYLALARATTEFIRREQEAAVRSSSFCMGQAAVTPLLSDPT
ncbi:MAG: molecular chaperone TorD family protein [Chloroflexota bacterium]